MLKRRPASARWRGQSRAVAGVRLEPVYRERLDPVADDDLEKLLAAAEHAVGTVIRRGQ
jgi:hypothetical protein